MKKEVAAAICGQAQGIPENLVYEVSRQPNNIHKKMFAPLHAPLITPSGGRVPPGWTNIWITTDPESPIQAIGRDSKGRRVYLYSAKHMGMAAAAKFSRLKAFNKAYPSLLNKIKRDINNSEAALVLYLIAKTGFRIGSNVNTGANVKAFGASTLRCSHINVEGNRISFDFVGKKGIRVTKILKDSFLARNIAGRCNIEVDGQIFKTTDEGIRAYLKSISAGSAFTVKDFRTYLGTMTAFRKIKTLPVPQNGRELKRYKKEVGKTVAAELGNSPAIAQNSYIAPEVYCAWEFNTPLPLKKAGGPHTSFRNEFLECIHYDREVSMEETIDSDPDGRNDED
jgi:DNA topoisomerase-1